MGLITEDTVPLFDAELIHAGDLIRAKHRSWDGFRNGIVSRVGRHNVLVQHLPGFGISTNHFVIRAEEAVSDEWEAIWTSDFGTVFHFPEEVGSTQEGGGTDDP